MSQVEVISVLAAAAAKSAVILSLAGLVVALWRNSSASTRHLVWTIGITAALAIPALGALVSRMNAPVIRVPAWTPAPAPAARDQVGTPVANEVPRQTGHFEHSILTGQPTVTGFPESTSAAANQPAITEPSVRLETTRSIERQSLAERSMIFIEDRLLYIWLAGMFFSLLPLVTGIARISVLARRSRGSTASRWSDLIARTPAIAHHSGRVRIVESDGTAMPMTWGILQPTLLVPGDSSAWPEWKCRNILLHELAHIERRDCLTQLLAQLACAVYWFNPLVWIAAHRMRVERELACDDRVISAGSAASEYASDLLDVARSLRAPSFTSPTAIAMARPSQLSGRLLAVLDAKRNRSSVTRGIRAGISCAAVAVVIPMSFIIPGASGTRAPGVVAVAGMTVPASHKSRIASTPKAAAAAEVTSAQVPTVSVFVSTGDALSPSSFPVQQGSACWADDSKGSTHISSSSNDEGDAHQSFEVRYTRDNCSLEVNASGKFTLRPDLSDIESISNDGWFRVEERLGRDSKRVEIRRASNGSLDHQYWVNGDRTPFNDEGRAWLARTLLSVERKTAIAASTRVPQLYRSGGLRGLMGEIAQMESAYAKSAYYKTFLDMGVSLDANTLNTVVRQATTDLSSSDYYLAEVLSKFSVQPTVNEATWRTFAEAAGTMKSDYYRSEVLKKVLKSGRLSSATVGILLNSASGMKSDYYLSELLQSVARQYAVSADTRAYYVDALRKIDSDYYRGQVLSTLTSDGAWDAKTSAFVLTSVADMKSEYYRSEALKDLVKSRHVTDWPSYFNAVATIPSDYYKREALNAALRQTPLNRDIVAGAISVAARMHSDNDKTELLSQVASVYRIDDALRPAFERAVDSISSDYYRGSALSALRRSMAR